MLCESQLHVAYDVGGPEMLTVENKYASTCERERAESCQLNVEPQRVYLKFIRLVTVSYGQEETSKSSIYSI